MRLLKAQNTNLRNIYGKGIKYDINGQVIVDTTNAMLVPKGTGDTAYSAGTDENQRPTSPTNGHVRYNTDTNELEVYQDSSWRNVRFKEPVSITQQSLGNGSGIGSGIVLFGPLDSQDTNTDYTAPVAAQNILVFVENVFQVATTNYTLTQNPSSTATGAETAITALVPGTEYIVTSAGDSDFTTVGAADSLQGTTFTATGPGTGTGLARETGYYIEFTSEPDIKPITVLHNFDK